MKRYHMVIFSAALALLAYAPSSAWSAGGPCVASIDECPIQGCSSSPSAQAPFDRYLNEKKNRDANQIPPDHLRPLNVDDALNPRVLPTHSPSSGNPKDLREAWLSNDPAAQSVLAMENHQTAVIGYILRAKPGDGESCNCDLTDRNVVDTHINLIQDVDTQADPRDLLYRSMIVEVTHRIRNSAWTVRALNAISLTSGKTTPRVRIIGALTYDNSHWDMLRQGTRGTLWEVHPITEIDVEVNGTFKPFTARSAQTVFSLVRRGPNQPLLLSTGSNVQFTNAMRARWTPEQIQALDQRMEEDDRS